MNGSEIVKTYLKTNGYDGLYNESMDCGCESSDLIACGELGEDCQPGFRQKCDPETCVIGGDCDFHIGSEKELQS